MRRLIFTLILTTAACADRPASDAAATDTTAAQPADTSGGAMGAQASQTGLLPGTPAGGMAEWVDEIRKGVADVPQRATSDLAGAQKQAMDLYLTRQEYLEMYWGPGGRLTKSEELGTAVKDAEARFHELLQLLQGGSPAQAQLRTAVDAMDAQYQKVLDIARREGVQMMPDSAAGK